MVELVYGAENPILDKTLIPGRGAITKAIHGTPQHRMFVDLVRRKQLLDRAQRDASVTG